MKMEKDKCKECEALKKGTTWIGKPPKCAKHRRKNTKNTYWS